MRLKTCVRFFLSRAARESPSSALSFAALRPRPARRRKVGVPGSARAGEGAEGRAGPGAAPGRWGLFRLRGSVWVRVGPVCRSVQELSLEDGRRWLKEYREAFCCGLTVQIPKHIPVADTTCASQVNGHTGSLQTYSGDFLQYL